MTMMMMVVVELPVSVRLRVLPLRSRQDIRGGFLAPRLRLLHTLKQQKSPSWISS